jgi:hypothetical protein
MPIDWKFGFEYLPASEVSSFDYDNLPKNYLILTHIQVLGENKKPRKIITDVDVLNKWADLLDVQRPPVIFEGDLNPSQKDKIINLLAMSDLEYSKSFSNSSFTREVYNIFNPMLVNSALNNNIDKEIDGLVISFINSTKIKSYKIESFDRKSEHSDERESSHAYQITIVDLLEFLNNYNLDEIELNEENSDLRYIELISTIYNSYLEKNAFKYIGAKFDSAVFSNIELLKLNTNYIKIETTLK